MSAKIQLRRDSSWTGSDSLAAGEVGLEFNTSGVVSGVKIGPSGGSTWSSIDYLEGTFPFKASSASDLNDATLKKTGRFKWTAATAITTNSPITFAADDGAATMIVAVYGISSTQSVVQTLSSEGNGTVPSKHFVRVFDGDANAWRTWENVNTWATSSTDGTDLTAKNITAKGVVKIANGTLANPSIAFENDTNTGLYISGSDQLGIAVNGFKSAYLTSTQLVTNSISCTTTSFLTGAVAMGSTLGVNGLSTFSGGAAMASNRLTGVGDPIAPQDAVTKAYLESTRVGQIAVLKTDSTLLTQQVGAVTSGVFTFTATNAMYSTVGTWNGIIGNGNGNFNTVTIGPTAPVFGTGASISSIGYGSTNAFWLILARIA